jgi:hypothetical protein
VIYQDGLDEIIFNVIETNSCVVYVRVGRTPGV